MFTHESKIAFSIAVEATQNLIDQTKQRLPVDIFRIAEILGFTIEEAEIQWPGYIMEGDNIIVVRRRDLPTRKRFTVAHEIGHILWRKACQQPFKTNNIFRRARHSEEEIIANKLATELLMPKTKYEDVLAEYKYPSIGAVRGMARLFGVSFESCVRRITELQDYAAFAYWYDLSKNGQVDYEVRFKKGYSSYPGLRFIEPPFNIVNKCIEKMSRTSRAWRGYLRFQSGELQVEIPSMVEFVNKEQRAWVCIFGWRGLNRPILSQIQTNQLVNFQV